MTTEAPPVTLGEIIVGKLREAALPMVVKDLAKGMPKLKGEKPAGLEGRIKQSLDAEIAATHIFSQPTGKSGAVRYWHKDERHHLREKIQAEAVKPQPLPTLVKLVARETKADAGFVEGLIRELIGDDILYEHDGGKKGKMWCVEPPPPPTPPLETVAGLKEFAKVTKAFEAAMKKVGIDATVLLAALDKHYSPTSADTVSPERKTAGSPGITAADLEKHILEQVGREGTMSLNTLRHAMPEGGRGEVFDQAILSLDERGQVMLSRDFDPSHFSPAEQQEYVREGELLFTSIAKRS